MFLLKQISILAFSVLLFFASTGVLVFHHHCKKEGHTTQLFSPVNHGCEEEDKADTCDMFSCCSSANEKEGSDFFIGENECCSSATELVKIVNDLDVHNTSEIFFEQSLVLEFNFNVKFEFKERHISLACNDPPYFLQTPDLLAQIQTYLI